MLREKIANRIFNNIYENNELDSELHGLLEDAGISGDHYSDYHFDPYDSSIEFDCCAPDLRLAPEHQAALWNLGFARCWLNHSDGWETYYFEKGPAEGSRSEKRAA